MKKVNRVLLTLSSYFITLGVAVVGIQLISIGIKLYDTNMFEAIGIIGGSVGMMFGYAFANWIVPYVTNNISS